MQDRALPVRRSEGFARLAAALAGVVCAAGCAAPNAARGPRFDAGFLASRDTDVYGHARVRALGPLWEARSDDARREFSAVRPVWSRTSDPDENRSRTEVLWPVGASKVFLGQRTWRFIPAYGVDFDVDDDASRWRFMLFPFVFAGRDAKGDRYFALFPLGGTVHELLGRDKVWFVLFPLYGHSTVGELTTHSVLWPVYSRTSGGDVSRWRVFPVYGRSVQGDRWSKRFVLWPLWTSASYHLPGSSGNAFVLWPLVGRVDLENEQTWMFLPPLFRWTRNDKQTRVFCPWPLFQYETGEVDKLYFWPIWGRKSFGGVHTSFAFWPIVSAQRVERGDHDLRRFRVLPFVHHEARLAPSGGEADSREVQARHFKFWPLISYRREGDEARWRTLDLWPLKETGGVERNLAPIWTLFSSERAGSVREQEWLWGLVRRRRDGEGNRRFSFFPLIESERSSGEDAGRGWSILKGLFAYEENALRRRHRLLYFIRLDRERRSMDPTTGGREP